MTKFREYKTCRCQQCHSGSRKKHKKQAHKQFRHMAKIALWRGGDGECGKIATKPMWD